MAKRDRIPSAKSVERQRLHNIQRRRLVGLVRKHARLSRQLAFLAEQIQQLQQELGVQVPDRSPAKTHDPGTLADTIASVLTNRPTSLSEIVEAVQERGYISFSPNFRTQVVNTMRKDKRFKRVGRGLYVTK